MLDRQRRTLQGDNIVLGPTPEAPREPATPADPTAPPETPSPVQPTLPAPQPLTGVTAGDTHSIWTLKFEPRHPGQKRPDDLAQALGVEYRPDREPERTSRDPQQPPADRWPQHPSLDDPPGRPDEDKDKA